MLPQIVFGMFLMTIAGLLAWQSRQVLGQEDLSRSSDEERRLHRRRYRVRLVGIVLIGLIGLAMVTGVFVHNPRRLLFLWGGVLCLVMALVAIAFLDFLTTGRQVRLLRTRHRESQEQLRAEVAAELARRRQSTDPTSG